jgi:hypothetical protein
MGINVSHLTVPRVTGDIKSGSIQGLDGFWLLNRDEPMY